MPTQNKTINSLSFTFIVIYATCSTALLGIPSSLSALVNQDAWLFPVIGSTLGIGVVFLYTVLGRWAPKANIFEMNDMILGRPLGQVATFVYVLFPLFHFPAINSYGISFITHFLLPSTPFFVIFLLCLTIILFGVFSGIEAIARTATLISLFFIVPLVILIGLNLPDIDLKQMQPFAHTALTRDGWEALAFFMGNVVCNVVIQLSIFPKYLGNKKTGERGLWVGYSIGCFILIVITFLCITVLSPEVTARDFYPALSLAQRIELGTFLERIEATITILWFISIYFNLLLYLFALVEGFKHFWRLKESKPLILPFGLILLFVGVTLFANVVQEREFYRYVSIPQSILTGFVLPFLLVSVGVIKRKAKNQQLYPKHSTEQNQ
ncbi:spore germination protein KB [Alkalihalobacillus xiaoxiensis]|uniref:Spore germination protein KB n=1 Tax=Shouchella xiaoxiensis TaxID=766895 RepID=A0ABS2SX03_9BACI|nr:endospore germination permease [Shouchella xiaoxiensis]MBM7838767.1 spore germination protein KB [Shouchella xiaoxiensis]